MFARLWNFLMGDGSVQAKDIETVCKESLCKGREADFARLMLADEDPKRSIFDHYTEAEQTALTWDELRLVESTARHYTLEEGWARWGLRRHLASLAMREMAFLSEQIGVLDVGLVRIRSNKGALHRDRAGWDMLAKRRFLITVRTIRKEAQV